MRRPEQRIAPASVAGVTVGAALRDYRFWIIAASKLRVALGVGGSITNFQPLLMDRDFEPAKAARVAGVIGLSLIAGRLIAGPLIDRYWAPLVSLPMLALPALACILLAQPQVAMPAALLALGRYPRFEQAPTAATPG